MLFGHNARHCQWRKHRSQVVFTMFGAIGFLAGSLLILPEAMGANRLKSDSRASANDRSPSDQELNAAYKQRLKERRRVAMQRRYAKYGRKSYNQPPTYFPAAFRPRIASVRQIYPYRPVSSCRPSRRSLRLVYADRYRH